MQCAVSFFPVKISLFLRRHSSQIVSMYMYVVDISICCSRVMVSVFLRRGNWHINQPSVRVKIYTFTMPASGEHTKTKISKGQLTNFFRLTMPWLPWQS